MSASSTPDGSELCRDRTFTTRHLSHLPLTCRLSNALHTVTVDYAQQKDIPLCRQFIQHAASTGDNVGVDEYADEASYTMLFGLSELFAVWSLDGARSTASTSSSNASSIVAFVAVQPSLYARGIDKCLASLHVFRAPDVTSDIEAFQSLLRLAVELTSQLELGYTQCVVSTSLCCEQQLAALRAERFSICAILPAAVNLAAIGLRENVIMTKHLGLPDRPPRALSDVMDCWSQFAAANLPATPPPLPSLDFLPRHYTFQCGVTCVCRNVLESDVTALYELMSEASERGEGYALYEHPTSDYFRRTMLSDNHCVVYEHASTRDVIGFSILCDSFFTRTKVGGLGESDTLVASKYRSLGIGREITHIEISMMKQTGRTAGINDTMISNERMLNISRSSGIAFLGVIPRAACRPTAADADGNVGWVWEDTILQFYNFYPVYMEFLPFSQLCDVNQQQQHSSSKL